MHTPRLVPALLLTLLCGCNSAVRPWDGDAGEDGASGPFSPCNPDLRRYQQMPYREPDTPSYLQQPQPEPPPNGYGIIPLFPPTANNGPSYVTYWLTGDEDLAFTVRIMRGGTVFEDRPEPFQGVLFLDGMQASFEFEGRSTSVMRGAFTPRVNRIEFPIRVPASAIADGGHTATLFFVKTEAPAFLAARGVISLSVQFHVLKNATDFRDPYLPASAEIVPWLARRSGIYDPATGRPLDGLIAPPVGGMLPLRIEGDPTDNEVRRCPGATQNYLYAALLDGQQIPLGELGMHPLVTLVPTQSAKLDTVLQGLPSDGRPHQLVIVELPNYHRYMEAALGRYTAWGIDSPDIIGLVRW
jgi:hypothetical protein